MTIEDLANVIKNTMPSDRKIQFVKSVLVPDEMDELFRTMISQEQSRILRAMLKNGKDEKIIGVPQDENQ